MPTRPARYFRGAIRRSTVPAANKASAPTAHCASSTRVRSRVLQPNAPLHRNARNRRAATSLSLRRTPPRSRFRSVGRPHARVARDQRPGRRRVSAAAIRSHFRPPTGRELRRQIAASATVCRRDLRQLKSRTFSSSAHRGSLGVLERLLRGLALESQDVRPLEPGEFHILKL